MAGMVSLLLSSLISPTMPAEAVGEAAMPGLGVGEGEEMGVELLLGV